MVARGWAARALGGGTSTGKPSAGSAQGITGKRTWGGLREGLAPPPAAGRRGKCPRREEKRHRPRLSWVPGLPACRLPPTCADTRPRHPRRPVGRSGAQGRMGKGPPSDAREKAGTEGRGAQQEGLVCAWPTPRARGWFLCKERFVCLIGRALHAPEGTRYTAGRKAQPCRPSVPTAGRPHAWCAGCWGAPA